MSNAIAPVVLRVSLTTACGLRCRYCRPAGAKARSMSPTPWPQWLRRLAAVAAAVNVTRIRFTGGEPLRYPDILPLVRACASSSMPELALTTNGVGLADVARKLADAGLRRVNISLDAVDKKIYRAVTGAAPAGVFTGIDAAIDAGHTVKLNAVILRGLNDQELLPLLRFAAARGIAIRYLEMMPIGPAAADFHHYYLSGAAMMQQMEQEGVSFTPLPYAPGATSRDFEARLPDGGVARCGFILPASRPFCEDCRRLRLTADGQLMGCLAQPDAAALDIAVAAVEAGDVQPMQHLIGQALAVKTRQQRFADQRIMQAVGG